MKITIVADKLEVSDGYHTMDELYEHRMALWIALAQLVAESGGEVWRSHYHSDGSRFEGWFILGVGKKPGKQMTYHLPVGLWSETDFAEVLLSNTVPEFDGHTSADVLERLKEL